MRYGMVHYIYSASWVSVLSSNKILGGIEMKDYKTNFIKNIELFLWCFNLSLDDIKIDWEDYV